ncbi:MAG: mevalonate kinase [Anaerolineae bacterium]|nr:mevalonate kinase [Anaerolineae bacterium]
MKVTASAPGKLVLFGDHAAVYDRPCIVTAVDIRFQVAIETSAGNDIEISTPTLRAAGHLRRTTSDKLDGSEPATAFVEAAIRQFFSRHARPQGLRVTTDGPQITYGLGSSSAVSAATVHALAALFDISLELRTVFEIAYAAVLDVQRTGSGIDVAAAVYGGTLLYQRQPRQIEPLETPALPLVIGYSGEKVSTTNYLSQVAGLRGRHTAHIEELFDFMGKLVNNAHTALLMGDWQTLGELANIHQGLLDALGVTTPQLFLPIYAAREAGAYGAKLSGAGGGDCMFAIAATDQQVAVRKAINAVGGTVVDLATGVDGVRLE